MTFSGEELRAIARLDSPYKIQCFLTGLHYSADDFYRCPRRVLRDRQAHCFDGALFAAAALACYLPARRVLSIDPGAALRE